MILQSSPLYTAQKIKFTIKDFFSKCDQIRSKLRIWSYLLRMSLMENLFFCAVLCIRGGPVYVSTFSCCTFLILKNIENKRKTENTTKETTLHSVP